MSDSYDLMRAINMSGGSGGGGTSNYNQLSNKPSINNVSLQGNKSLSDLGLYSKSEVDALVSGGGGNVIETEIESVEETYEEGGEEYTERVWKFTNEEALLNAIYGENRDELNSLTIAIKYRAVFNPTEFSPEISSDSILKNLSDEFTEYYHCTNYLYIEENIEGNIEYEERYLYLQGKKGDFYGSFYNQYGENPYVNFQCKNVCTYINVSVVMDENFKPCGLVITNSNGTAFFERFSASEEELISFIYPMIGIDDWYSDAYIYTTEEYDYWTDIRYQMCSEDFFRDYAVTDFTVTNSKISVDSLCEFKIGTGCNVAYNVFLVMNEVESFSDDELLVQLNYNKWSSEPIVIIAKAYYNNTFAGYVDLVLDPNGEIYTRQSISGIDTLRFSVSYPIDPFDMPYLW